MIIGIQINANVATPKSQHILTPISDKTAWLAALSFKLWCSTYVFSSSYACDRLRGQASYNM